MYARLVAVSFLVVLAGCAAPVETSATRDADAAPVVADCLADLAGLDLHTVTIPDLQAALADGRITSVQLVDAYAARIAAYDDAGPALNSIQEVSPTARAQAIALDEERAAGKLRGPLHGIPILLKDNIGTFDQPTTAGSAALAANVPPDDATLTAKLRGAGAIILGKAQLSEFAHWRGLDNPSGWSSHGGQVVNAYTGGDPSGSSSGSGVAASMAFAAATIGTETSGSILSPSNANSVVGVKPTTGLVSRMGVIPLAESFDTPGPMTRTVVDAALVLGAIAGTDPADKRTAEADAHVADYAAGLARGALEGARLGYEPRDDEVFARALDDLAARGATLVPIDARNADEVSLLEIPALFNEFKFGLNDYLARVAGPGLPVKDLTEIILFNEQNSHPDYQKDRVTYGQDLLIASDATPGLSLLIAPSATPIILANRAVADRLFAQNDLDVIVGLDAPLTGLGAAAGYPTVTVPAGYEGRAPHGLSFFGPAWSEAKLLAYAYDYEQASLRRVPPPAIAAGLLDGVC